MRVWTRAASFDSSRGSLRTWVLTVVRNRAVDYLRGAPARQRDELELRVEVPATGAGSDPWREVAESLERCAVREALASLPSEQRQTIELAYYGGYTQTEIAQLAGVPLGTVRAARGLRWKSSVRTCKAGE